MANNDEATTQPDAFATYLRGEAAKYRLMGGPHAERLASILEGVGALSEATHSPTVVIEAGRLRVKVETNGS